MTDRMEHWRGGHNEYVFEGMALTIRVHRYDERSRWLLTCEGVRIVDVPLEDREIEQAINQAVDLVAKRVVWLAEVWKRDLRKFTSAITVDLDIAIEGRRPV